jgi:hypothetical protein
LDTIRFLHQEQTSRSHQLRTLASLPYRWAICAKVRLKLVLAGFAPYDQPHASRSGIPESYRRAGPYMWLFIHRTRLGGSSRRMPKWSEVPWGTVITGVIAIYGAVLSTVNSVSQRRRDHLATQRQLRQDQLAMQEARRRQAD